MNGKGDPANGVWDSSFLVLLDHLIFNPLYYVIRLRLFVYFFVWIIESLSDKVIIIIGSLRNAVE
jgi:hypothetical protein